MHHWDWHYSAEICLSSDSRINIIKRIRGRHEAGRECLAGSFREVRWFEVTIIQYRCTFYCLVDNLGVLNAFFMHLHRNVFWLKKN